MRLTIDGEGPSGESTSVSLTAGAGVVSWDGEAALTPAALIHQAEVALRKAKQLGRSRRYAFETDDAEFARLREDMRLSMELSVEINPDVCIGCKYCFQACPYEVPKYNSVSMDKCDCCQGSGVAIGEDRSLLRARVQIRRLAIRAFG